VPTAWRLVKAKYLAAAWDGEGAKRTGGRWNSTGTAVVYASGTLALALVETLVHLPSGVLPAYTAVPIDFDAALVTALDARNLPGDWMRDPAPASTMAIGDAWVSAASSAVFRVPSVVVPMECNYLLNPNHPDFAQIRIGEPLPFPFDSRLPLPQKRDHPTTRRA
jgi:RES domain-containing protein